MKKNTLTGLILILVGLIWLLGNLHILSFNLIRVFFSSLGTLWPLILIGTGSSLLFRKHSVFKLLIWLIILAVIIVYGLYENNTTPNNYTYNLPISSSLEYTYTEDHDYFLSKETNTEESSLKLALSAPK